MTIMEPTKVEPEGVEKHVKPPKKDEDENGRGVKTDGIQDKSDANIFSDENLRKDEKLEVQSDTYPEGELTITSEDKVAFIDSIVENGRFKKEYSLFGGKVKLTLRSLTSDEVNALSSWIVKSGANDTSGIITGRYRKYLAAAQIECLNGVRMKPLEEPLFETVGNDGKSTVPPGWINRCSYWDKMPSGLFDTIIGKIKQFDALYSMLCRKAEDSNFWNPDTP